MRHAATFAVLPALGSSAVLVRTSCSPAAGPCLARVDRWGFNDLAGRFGTIRDKP